MTSFAPSPSTSEYEHPFIFVGLPGDCLKIKLRITNKMFRSKLCKFNAKEPGRPKLEAIRTTYIDNHNYSRGMSGQFHGQIRLDPYNYTLDYIGKKNKVIPEKLKAMAIDTILENFEFNEYIEENPAQKGSDIQNKYTYSVYVAQGARPPYTVYGITISYEISINIPEIHKYGSYVPVGMLRLVKHPDLGQVIFLVESYRETISNMKETIKLERLPEDYTISVRNAWLGLWYKGQGGPLFIHHTDRFRSIRKMIRCENGKTKYVQYCWTGSEHFLPFVGRKHNRTIFPNLFLSASYADNWKFLRHVLAVTNERQDFRDEVGICLAKRCGGNLIKHYNHQVEKACPTYNQAVIMHSVCEINKCKCKYRRIVEEILEDIDPYNNLRNRPIIFNIEDLREKHTNFESADSEHASVMNYLWVLIHQLELPKLRLGTSFHSELDLILYDCRE